MIQPASVMVNILGQLEGVVHGSGLKNALKIPGVYVHIYGKRHTRPGRKMGHVTAIGHSVEEAFDKATRASSFILFSVNLLSQIGTM